MEFEQQALNRVRRIPERGQYDQATIYAIIDAALLCHVAFAVEALEIQPFPVPHDAREPVQYVFSDGVWRLGLLTDAGDVTQHMRNVLSGVDGLVLECNHDAALLAALPRHVGRPAG